jgi:hypothetical protein
VLGVRDEFVESETPNWIHAPASAREKFHIVEIAPYLLKKNGRVANKNLATLRNNC